MHKSLRVDFFVFCSSIVFLGVFLIGFQSQEFWGFISPVQDLGTGVPDVELESLTPHGKDPCLCDPSCWWIAVTGV